MCGITLNGSGCAKILFGALSTSLFRRDRVPCWSSSIPSCPAPEAAWYVYQVEFREFVMDL